MKSFFVAPASIVFLVSALALASEPAGWPAGWKAPRKIQNSGCPERKTSDLFEARGDFDGDGKEDVARLLARKSGHGLGVWIWRGSGAEPVLAAQSESVDGKHDMGISVAAPGKYKTACGKGYATACKSQEVVAEHPGVSFFTCESASRLIYWTGRKFLSAWMSD